MTSEAPSSEQAPREPARIGTPVARAALLLGAPGLLSAYVAYAAAGAAAAASALLALALTLVLVIVVLGDETSVERRTADRLVRAGLLALPGALTVLLCFDSGGYFPGGPAFAAVVLAAVLAVRNALAARPFERMSRQAGLAATALALLAAWTLLSALWSESVERALIEFDRVAVYGLALVLFAALPERLRELRWLLRALALAIVAVCVVALITRVLPEVWPIEPTIGNKRLSYPLGYWNALGVLASIGLVLCLHLGSSEGEPPVARVLGCAACPVLAATLLLTFSRGAMVVAVLGLIVYAIAGRPRLLLSGLLASVPPAAIAVVVAYGADRLSSDDPTTPAAVAQGKEVALALGLTVVGAAAVRCLLLPIDARLARLRLSRPMWRRVAASAAALAVAAGLLIVAASDVPQRLRDQYDRFVSGSTPSQLAPARDRLTDPSSAERVAQWKVALRGFERAPVTGQGAGTYELLWAKERSEREGIQVNDAHSLYAEVAGELGAVGLLLVVVAVSSILGGAALRCRGPERAGYAAVFAAGLAWAVHAGVDWDWEVPATGLWLFALGGAVLAGHARAGPHNGETRSVIRVVALLSVLLVAAPAALVGLSQTQVDESVDAFGRGDCRAAEESASSDAVVLDVRAAPRAIVAYCHAARGLEAQSLREIETAVERDPEKSELHYGLAVVRAAAGRDPRSAAKEAVRLDPLNPLARDVVRLFDTEDPAKWERGAMQAPLSLSREGPFVDLTELDGGS